jgi:ribosomal protein L32
MLTSILIDLLSILFVAITLVLLWKEKDRFFSLIPLLPAFALIGVGRMCDLLLEHEDLHLNRLVGISPLTLNFWLALTGSITDAGGFACMIYGLVKVIKNHRKKQRQIHQLETLLPLCANCGRYRTSDDRWLPIEKYRIEIGRAKLTHSICPDCASRFSGEDRKKEKR